MEQLDVSGLKPEEVKLLKEFLELLKARAIKQQAPEKEVEYRSWPLGVKGKITRKDIYDYL